MTAMGTSPNPGLVKTFTTGAAAVAAYTIVAHGDAAGTVVGASAAGDAMFGVTQQLGAGAGQRVDVCLGGLPEVLCGGAVAAGDPLTADAESRAVKAAPAPGAQVRIIGFAMMDAVAGDIVPFQFAPGAVTAPAGV